MSFAFARRAFGLVPTALTLALLGCGQSTQQRVPTPGPRTAVTKDRSQGQSADGARAGADSTVEENGPVADPADLAPYLLTHADAARLFAPLVLEEKLASDDGKLDVEPFAAMRPVEAYIDRFLKKALAQKELKPGRTVQVIVTDDAEVNASMDGWGRMVVNSAIVESAGVDSILATLCHELAHSARNHAVADEALFDDPIAEEIAAYWESHYDADRLTYVHDEAAYKALVKRAAKFLRRVSVAYRRSESEADVAGARICEHLGMPVSKFRNAAHALFAVIAAAHDGGSDEGLVAPERLEDGLVFEDVPNDGAFLWSYLLGFDDHPGDAEREQQLARLADAIELKEGRPSDLYVSWTKGFTAARGKRPGLSLGDTRAPARILGRSSDGDVVVRSRRAPAHPWPIRKR
jgi:hypothetical protein